MDFHRRRLPHIYPDGKWLFVTWRLASGRQGDAGQAFLRQPHIAEAVARSIRKGTELGHYRLRAWVVMPNHVHVLLLPLAPPSRLLQSLKGYTARQANLLLGRAGQSFWQAESYDHWIRDEKEFENVVKYIEDNPVRAGLVSCPSEYRWSSAAAD